MSIRTLLLSLTLLFSMSLVAACGGAAATPTASNADTPSDTTANAPTTEAVAAPTEGPATEATGSGEAVTLWSHSAGNPDEIAVVENMIADYNGSQDKYEVVLESFPQASYNDSVAAASVAGSLPCIVDLDAPTVPNFAWSGYLQPLPITDAELQQLDVLANDVGRYNGQVYSMGQFDVALLVYARRSVLEENGIRIPTLDAPWTKDEFDAALDTLKDSGNFEYAIDMNAASTGEWWPYAYSPLLQSFGGDLIDRDSNYQTAEGALNGPEAVAWGEWFQNLFTGGYSPANPADDQGFLQGEIALWYNGSWAADSVLDTYGEDALFLPPPDLGTGPKVGAGSWQFGISTNCTHPEGAAEFIKYTMTPENVAMMSKSSSLIPTTSGGAALTERYAEGSPFRIFYDMAERFAVVRPETPGYLTISSQFEQAGTKIRDGGNVQDALDDAVDAIDQNAADNNGFGFQ